MTCERILCYFDCLWMNNDEKSITHLKCLYYQHYVYTPERAERCKHRLDSKEERRGK